MEASKEIGTAEHVLLKKQSAKKRVAIFGGSFDPPTISHLEVSIRASHSAAVDAHYKEVGGVFELLMVETDSYLEIGCF